MGTNRIWRASAPSNIALIKYAGKKDKENRPINPSLSYTLKHFISTVEITPLPEKEAPATDIWKPLKDTTYPLNLSSEAITRFLKFFQYLKNTFEIDGFFCLGSGNNFPASCGVASSASSFCALTLATYKTAQDRSEKKKELSLSELSALSRQGSGSSCRSFFHPWALWENNTASEISIEPFPYLIHQLVLSDEKQKPVSSSEAHQRILTSPCFKNREQRAKKRLSSLLSALQKNNWMECFQIVWEEFEDLHQLYETANPPIRYRTGSTYKILDMVKDFWEETGTGPLVTMDAGSPVHLLYRPDQKEIYKNLAGRLSKEFKIIYSQPPHI